jgi:hypothetical protein
LFFALALKLFRFFPLFLLRERSLRHSGGKKQKKKNKIVKLVGIKLQNLRSELDENEEVKLDGFLTCTAQREKFFSGTLSAHFSQQPTI